MQLSSDFTVLRTQLISDLTRSYVHSISTHFENNNNNTSVLAFCVASGQELLLEAHYHHNDNRNTHNNLETAGELCPGSREE